MKWKAIVLIIIIIILIVSNVFAREFITSKNSKPEFEGVVSEAMKLDDRFASSTMNSSLSNDRVVPTGPNPLHN